MKRFKLYLKNYTKVWVIRDNSSALYDNLINLEMEPDKANDVLKWYEKSNINDVYDDGIYVIEIIE